MGSGGGWLVILLVLWNVQHLASLPSSVVGRNAGGNGLVPITTNFHRRSILQADQVVCPLDFSILHKYTWINEECGPDLNTTTCCMAVLSGIGLGTSKYLKESGFFELQDAATVDACLTSFESQLREIGVQRDVVSECFKANPLNSSMFIRSPSLCQGIQTVEDFARVAGALAMDTSCKSNLVDHDQCTLCVNDMYTAIAKLTKINVSTSSECFDFVLVYAAGVVNVDGPWDAGTAYCILAVPTGAQNGPKRVKVGLYVGIGALGAGLISIAAGFAFWYWLLRRRAAIHREFVARNNRMLKPNALSLVWYEWAELKAATHGFSQKCLLGEGGYGSVYKGVLKDGRTVAVKRFRNCMPEGDLDFLNEVEVISKVKHRHLVVLNGCCVASSNSEGHQRMLVYDFMSHGSLADYLFSKGNPVLEWPERRKIGIGMAKGLAYLHAEVVPQIIHRDIKPSNILLDEHFNARVADFGLAKLTPENETHFTTHVAGTHGYVAPEYALYGQLTEKSDVYSFGVCLLELLSGRPALTESAENPSLCLVSDWAWWLVKEGRIMDVVDSSIRHKGPQDVMQRFVMVGILCAHVLVAFRPTVTEALRMLEGDADIPEIPDRPLPLNYDMLGDGENSYCYSAQSTPSGLGSISDPGSMSHRELLR
jgi:serine/threonine protein kinase